MTKSEPTLPVSQPEEDTRKCQDCGRDNPVWFAENEVWNAVFPERVGFVCPNCFIKRADPVVQNAGWKLIPDTAERDRELQQAIKERESFKQAVLNAQDELQQAREELKELEALRAGARTGMLKFMLAGDVGCFADRMRQLLQAEDWDAMRLCISDFFNAACDITQSGREEMDRLTTQVDEVSKCHLEAQRQSQLAWMRVAEHKVEAARIQDRAESAEQSLSEAREELARLKGLLAKFGHHDSDCNHYHGWNDKTCTCGFAEFEVIPEKPSYSESNGKVILTMSRKDYEDLIYFLKYAAGLTHRPTTEVIKLIDRLDSGNPNSYPVPEKPDTKGKS